MRSVVPSRHNELQFILVGFLFCSGYELPSDHGDEPRSDSHIALIGKGESTVLDKTAHQFRSGLVHVKVHARRDKYYIVIDWGHVRAPGANIAPAKHVHESLVENGFVTADRDDETVVGRQLVAVGHVADYFGGVVVKNFALLTIDGD